MPCEARRLSLKLASAGHETTGVGLSLPLLEQTKAKSDLQQLPITWEHRDMRDLPWTQEFDGAV